MANRRTARVAVCAGVEDTVSGVGEEVDEGVGETSNITIFLITQSILNQC